eukprot:TRINITY_DN37271_c0_g1_i1.p1 TRINITY_DN37271_c0_g1~~TRINITY_DN37271_c0_g1_i1.p1  ORF type:complete len:404 (+),score=91.18 TRINITY_DN37271_c0_g1_i1:94-1212(+)
MASRRAGGRRGAAALRLAPLAAACLGLALLARPLGAEAKLTFTDLEAVPKSESLADGFKVTLMRPPDEPANSGSKVLVQESSLQLLEPDERRVLDDYDAIFEKYSLFCNGRWLGAQVLQDSQDLMYLQHVVYMKKPDIIIETGTYKGGLTYFFASLLEWIGSEASGPNPNGGGSAAAQVVSVDRHHPDLVFAANWFCPVCADCIKPYETPVWERRVRFVQGYADAADTYNEVLAHLEQLSLLRAVVPEDGAGNAALVVDPSKVVVVNLDANHEYEGLLKELLFYAPMVSLNSYLIVQDAKLDKIWGTPGPTAALNMFLSLAPEGEFVVEHELKFHAYSQHMYVRRARVSVDYTYFLQRAHEMIAAAKAAGGA